jgi:protein SCO1/2
MKALCKYISIAIIVLFIGCTEKQQSYELPFYNGADFTPVWVLKGESIPDSIHKVDVFSFTDQNGETITNETYEDKIYAANFFFTSCPSICPVMTNNILQVEKEFKGDDDIMFISHSVTPDIDSVARLKTFSETYDIDDSKWHLVTGSKADIYNLAWYSYFADEDPGFSQDSSEFIHSEHILLVDKSGYVRGVYNGTLELEMERLSDDINILKRED